MMIVFCFGFSVCFFFPVFYFCPVVLHFLHLIMALDGRKKMKKEKKTFFYVNFDIKMEKALIYTSIHWLYREVAPSISLM
ncbi:hypothetical protein GDO78_006466 [Eleutherodactylus coqui]|uniref:Uncharacterized protein n=1 Tax=Eleutherodactylus coqui TaxID=57060 RepID=A0A8J6FND5_ELECQ|nr:hypothetical protein GDO78_006466 [Eleutherodactylus coqui]